VAGDATTQPGRLAIYTTLISLNLQTQSTERLSIRCFSLGVLAFLLVLFILAFLVHWQLISVPAVRAQPANSDATATMMRVHVMPSCAYFRGGCVHMLCLGLAWGRRLQAVPEAATRYVPAPMVEMVTGWSVCLPACLPGCIFACASCYARN